jgi:hypothetical protein
MSKKVMALFTVKAWQTLLLSCFCLSATLLSYAAEPPAFLPEFADGVKANAIWQDPNFFSAADQCNKQYECGNLSGQAQAAKMKLCQAQVKNLHGRLHD